MISEAADNYTELRYDQTNLTKGKYEKRCSMKWKIEVYYDDQSLEAFTPTKKEFSQAAQLWKRFCSLKSNQTLHLNSKRDYKNLSHLMGIINAKYLAYIGLVYAGGESDGIVTISVKGKNVQKAIKQNNKFKKKCEAVVQSLGINKKTTEHDAALLINNYLIDRIEYEENTIDDYKKYEDFVAIYTGKGICEDYARAFYFLTKTCGIKCGLIYDNVISGGHAYNVVNIGRRNFYIDVTWSDSVNNNSYFMVSKNYILREHTISILYW
jgi:transglutaminase-like putative cysteine protease